MVPGPEGLACLNNRFELAAYRKTYRNERIVLVPTMGFLHEGHLSLIRRARTLGDRVITSIFVNPTQFGPGEDLDSYPRDLDGDLAKARRAGSDAVFLPTVGDMYHPDATTTVQPGKLANALCGLSRPHHFSGVCTVVLKLFNLTGCDAAIFGEKDYQQLAIIRRMVRDLNHPVEVIGHPIVRELDGLAMSSRNTYLTAEERNQARALSRALNRAEHAWNLGEKNVSNLLGYAHEELSASPLAQIDYVTISDAQSLETLVGDIRGAALLALAVRFGSTRLIDNRVLTLCEPDPSNALDFSR